MMFKTKADWAAQFARLEGYMATLAAAVKGLSNADVYTPAGVWKQAQDAKSTAIFDTRRTVEAISAGAAADRARAEELLDGPEPQQTPEVLAQLSYQQALLLRRFPAGDQRIVAALAEAVEDGDAVRAQVLADMAAEVEWTIANMPTMERCEQLRVQAIALRASGERKAALAALQLLDGDSQQAGVDGKAKVIDQCVGERADAIVRAGGDDAMVGSFRLDWVTPPVASTSMLGPVGAYGTMAALGVVVPLSR